MKTPQLYRALCLASLAIGAAACGSTSASDNSASGGAPPLGSGGSSQPGSGGNEAGGGGGASGSGGATSASGGHISSGGQAASGGSPASGGAEQASGGEAPNSGGVAAGGGDTGSGGLQDDCDGALRTANRDATRSAIEGLFIDKDPSVIDQYWEDPYLQHNPIGQNGVAAFKSLMTSFVTSPSFSYTLHRTLANCELSVVLGTYSQTGVIFDMFRVSDGKLIEHWDSDSGQASDADPGLAGEVPHDETVNSAESEARVRGFIETVLIGDDRDVAEEYLGESFYDHRSEAAAGPGSLFTNLDNDSITYSKIHHLIADGNYVFVLSEGKLGSAAYGFYDLFRIAEGKIVERWDSRRSVPSSTTSGLPIF